MYLFLLFTTIASQAGMQGWVTLISNFGVEVANLNAFQMGVTHSVREIPGFLSVAVILLLLFMAEHKAAALSIVLLGLGLSVTGYFPTFAGVALTTFIFSTGFHFFEPLNQSLSLQYFDLASTPIILGRFRAVCAITNILVGAFIYLASGWLSYTGLFMCLGLVVTAMGLWALLQDPSDKSLPPQRKKMIMRKKYWLFYALTFLSGARRQILMVFAAFLLVQKFQYSIKAMTVLFVINNIVAYFANPLIGRMVNVYGERKLMSIEYAVAILVFLAYAFSDSHILVGFAFIIDQLSFSFVMCIRTYLQKIADPRDIAPSSAVGFTINHVAAVFIPLTGGALWLLDYRIPFEAGMVLAAISLILAQLVRIPNQAKMQKV
jgi:hypothetical protein